MTGFGIATLRNWERRYRLLVPRRLASGHRLYTKDDLATLLRVQRLLEAGQSIGEIAALGRTALLAAAGESARPDEPEPSGADEPSLPFQMLDALPCGIVLTDASGKTQWINKSLERICGYGMAELRGLTPGSVLQGPRTDPRTLQSIAAALGQQRPCSARILNYDANDRTYWADLDIAPLWLGTDLRGFVATVRDVTHEVDGQPAKASAQREP
jgi:PAS domain S-box-containing protein